MDKRNFPGTAKNKGVVSTLSFKVIRLFKNVLKKGAVKDE